jgi:hypothetical protein
MREKGRGTKSVLDEVVIRKESEIKKIHKEEINEFLIEEKSKTIICQNQKIPRDAEYQEIVNFLSNLDDNTYEEVKGKIFAIKRSVEERNQPTTSKRKMDKQEYYPSKRRC